MFIKLYGEKDRASEEGTGERVEEYWNCTQSAIYTDEWST